MGCGCGVSRGLGSSSKVVPLGPGDTASSSSPRSPGERSRNWKPEVTRFTEEERRSAWGRARFFDATGPQEAPVALWIIGPSAVGKTTLATEMAAEFGIGALANGAPDAVLVDGEFFRDAHTAYKRWAHSLEWATAYPAMKPLINEEKVQMTREAAAQRRHMVIPHTCLDLAKCMAEVQELREHGYLNHVLVVVARREDVANRGKEREKKTGKRYDASEFPKSIAAVVPMIKASNGRYILIMATELNEGDRQNLGHRTLAEGEAGADVDLDMEAYVGSSYDPAPLPTC